jgi:hypothetical protein
MGGVVALRWRGGTVHGLSFVVLVLLQVERVGSLMVVTVLVFMEVPLVGKMVWFVLTPLSSKWLGTGFTLLVLTLVLSRLFAHMLLTVKIRQPSHEFTFGVGISFIPYPLVLTPVV